MGAWEVFRHFDRTHIWEMMFEEGKKERSWIGDVYSVLYFLQRQAEHPWPSLDRNGDFYSQPSGDVSGKQ